jgi:hypothetical protein
MDLSFHLDFLRDLLYVYYFIFFNLDDNIVHFGARSVSNDLLGPILKVSYCEWDVHLVSFHLQLLIFCRTAELFFSFIR